MNTIRFIQSVIIFMIISTLNASAQVERTMPPQGFERSGGMAERPARPTATKRAEHRANEMAFVVNLDSKQYKKIFKIYLKEENAIDLAMGDFPPMGPPPAGIGGRMPSMPGGGFPAPGVGGPQAGMPFPGALAAPQTPKVGGKDIDSDEYIDAREAKFKKILTPEQYAIWREQHPDPSGFFHK